MKKLILIKIIFAILLLFAFSGCLPDESLSKKGEEEKGQGVLEETTLVVGCNSNDDCESNEFCENSECVLLECEKGFEALSHECVLKEVESAEADENIDETKVDEGNVSESENIVETPEEPIAETEEEIIEETFSKTFKDDLASDTVTAETNFSNQTITENIFPSLYYNSSKAFTCGGTNYSTSLQERIVFTANPEFRDNVSKPGLGLKVVSENLQYMLNLGSGVYDNEECSYSGSSNFLDNSNDSVIIQFFGKEYLVESYDKTGKQLTLLKSVYGKEMYTEGDTIEGVLGRDGKDYTIRVDGGKESSGIPKIYLTLLDSKGKEIFPSTGFAAGENVVFYSNETGEPLLDTFVYVKEILVTTSDKGGNIYTGNILVGTSRLVIKNEAGFPYDSTKSLEEYKWIASITSSNGRITQIAVKNNSNNIWVGENILRAGEEIYWINGFASLKFLGFQLPEFSVNGIASVENVSSFTLGNEKLIYKDNSYESLHEVPFYVYVSSAVNSGFGTFSIDGKTIYWKISLDNTGAFDGNVSFMKDSSNGDVISTVYFTDATVMGSNVISFQGLNDVVHEFVLLVDETGSSANFWLLLDDQDFYLQHGKYLSFKGTDTDEDGTVNVIYFEPDASELPSSFGTPSDTIYKIARFVFYEDGVNSGALDMNFNIDATAGSGDLIVLPNNNLSYYSDEVSYDAGGNGNAAWNLREDTPSLYISKAYTDYGTKIELNAQTAAVTFPENRAKVEILISKTQ